jgi:bifunctional non-homologous end joining protein LigD
LDRSIWAHDNYLMLPRIQPINPTRIRAPFDHSDWFFELKHDRFRSLAYIEKNACTLVSRKQVIYKSFAALRAAIAALPVTNAILDGEIVCLGADGHSQFAELMRRRQDVAYYAFDLLWADGEDLRPLPLVERKRRLRRLIQGRAGLLFAEQIQGDGIELFEAICTRDLEGIVAKHRLGPYEPRPVTWFKVLNPDYSQKRGRREMFDKFRNRDELHTAAARMSACDGSRVGGQKFT